MEDNKKEEIMNQINEVFNSTYTQPVLYLKKAPACDDIKKVVENNDNRLLHNSPLLSNGSLNSAYINICTGDNTNNNPIPSILESRETYNLSYKQIDLTAYNIELYVANNVIMSFCGMLDMTGIYFRKMIDYTPIRTYVQQELYDDNREILRFFKKIFYHSSSISYKELFSVYNDIKTEEEFYESCNKVKAMNLIYSSQLSQIIYRKLCAACDKAIQEILLGTRVSPNKHFMTECGMKYYGIKGDYHDPMISQQVYYRLNVDLVNMIDRFMSAVVVPMDTDLFEIGIYASLYYVFELFRNNHHRDVCIPEDTSDCSDAADDTGVFDF